MRYIDIPDRHISGFKQLVLISKDEYNSFKEQLLSFEFSGSNEIFDDIETFSKTLEQNNQEILSSLISIFLFHTEKEKIETSFLGQFIESFNEKAEPNSPNDSQILTERINELFSLNKVFLCGLKALSLQQEAEHLFSQGRVLTDIRPVFENDKAEISENYAIIMHRLKIEYNEEDGRKDIYFTMSRNQISELVETLNRALEKEKFIKSKSGFKFLQ